MVSKCRKCGSEQIVFMTSEAPSLASAMKRIYGVRSPEFDKVKLYKCNRCGNIFEISREDLSEEF